MLHVKRPGQFFENVSASKNHKAVSRETAIQFVIAYKNSQKSSTWNIIFCVSDFIKNRKMFHVKHFQRWPCYTVTDSPNTI